MVQQAVGIAQDGVLGPKTFAEANAMPSLGLIVKLQGIQAAFYRSIVASNPARQQFLNGWLARAYDRI